MAADTPEERKRAVEVLSSRIIRVGENPTDYTFHFVRAFSLTEKRVIFQMDAMPKNEIN